MPFIPHSVGQPYFNAVSAIADSTGSPIVCDGLKVATFTFVLAVGAGTTTGVIYFEVAAIASTPASTDWSRVLIPAGGLHTNVSGVALSTPVSATMGSTTVALTAVTSGSFTVTVSDLPVGQLRCVWDWASGTGASPNTLTAYAQGR
jgi:hypothetical protein